MSTRSELMLHAILIMVVLQYHLASSSMAPGPSPTSTPPQSPTDNSRLSVEHDYVNATVSLTSIGGAHRTIMEALSAAPSYSTTPYIIHVEAGIYNELVTVWQNRTNIWLIGDGAEVTKITMNRSYPAFRTYHTATFAVFGDKFVAKFISFENSAGPGAQAVAFKAENNRSAYYKCNFLGYQDTLYLRMGDQFFKDCNIYGTVDFIFGDAKAIFQSCNIYARNWHRIYFTAGGKRSPETDTAFVFQNCSFTAEPGIEQKQPQFKAYLGRPWFNYSTVVIIESYLDSIINPAGWAQWHGRSTNLLTYIEYNNHGPGSDTSNRVRWRGYRTLNQPNEVEKYTLQEFIQGDTWIPATGIPCVFGFIGS